MLKLLSVLLLTLTVHAGLAQTNDQFFVFDKNWKATSLTQAAYLVRVRKVEEKKILISTYQALGPRISQETFQDEDAQIRNGYCRYYHKNGHQDSVGAFVSNAQNGNWWYFNTDGKAIRKKVFDNGVLVKDSTIIPLPKDSIPKVDLAPGEVESQVKGGIKKWSRFLTANLLYPPRAYNNRVQGTVTLQFMIDETGKVNDADVVQSAEYSLDEEALRIMTVSPEWESAMKNGKAVKSYKRQPITFKF